MKFFIENKEVFFILSLLSIIVFSLKQKIIWVESKYVKKVKIEKSIWNYLDSKEKLLECKKISKDIKKCKKEISKVIKDMRTMDKVIFNKN
tara:strand:+ start:881 stop:1153 length:273 start_codon:yes stop_codon:yes gene_type:complete